MSSDDVDGLENVLSATHTVTFTSSGRGGKSKNGGQLPCMRKGVGLKDHQNRPTNRSKAEDSVSTMFAACESVLEEFILDDRELSLLDGRATPSRCRYRTMPSNIRTVSIIDTLSEMGVQGSTNVDDVLRPSKYQKKTSTTIGRRRHIRRTETADSMRDCLSDSEVKLRLRGVCDVERPKSSRPRSLSVWDGADDCYVSSDWSCAGGAVRNSSRSKPCTPSWIRTVFYMAKKGNIDGLKSSFEDVDASVIRSVTDASGNTLWHVCISYNQLRCLQWLCQKDDSEVPFGKRNRKGITPLQIAVKCGHVDILDWLTGSLPKLSLLSVDPTLIHTAVSYGQVNSLRWLCNWLRNKHSDVLLRDVLNQSIVVRTTSAENTLEEICGNTPMHSAAKMGHIECIKVLFSYGADVSSTNNVGLTPFHVAQLNHQTGCAHYLQLLEASRQIASRAMRARFPGRNDTAVEAFEELLRFSKNLVRRQAELIHCIKRLSTQRSSEARSQNRFQKVISILEKKMVLEETTVIRRLEDKWYSTRPDSSVFSGTSPNEHIMEIIDSINNVTERRTTGDVDDSFSISDTSSVSDRSVTEAADELFNRLQCDQILDDSENLWFWEQQNQIERECEIDPLLKLSSTPNVAPSSVAVSEDLALSLRSCTPPVPPPAKVDTRQQAKYTSGVESVRSVPSTVQSSEALPSPPQSTVASGTLAEPDLIRESKMVDRQSGSQEMDAVSSVDDSASLSSTLLALQQVSNGAAANSKKKGFLTKFSIKGRWSARPKSKKSPSSSSASTPYNEISAVDFKETYVRCSGASSTMSDGYGGSMTISPLPTAASDSPAFVEQTVHEKTTASQESREEEASPTGEEQMSFFSASPPRVEIKTATLIDISSVCQPTEGGGVTTSGEDAPPIGDTGKTTKVRKSTPSSKKRKAHRPWYELSDDDEDIVLLENLQQLECEEELVQASTTENS